MTVENSKYHSRSKLLEQIEQVWKLRANMRELHQISTNFGIAPICLVMQTLGHADVKTTQIYLEFPNGYLKEVFGKWIPDINGKLQSIKKTGAKA